MLYASVYRMMFDKKREHGIVCMVVLSSFPVFIRVLGLRDYIKKDIFRKENEWMMLNFVFRERSTVYRMFVCSLPAQKHLFYYYLLHPYTPR